VKELRGLYDAEQRLTKAIPKLADASSNSELIQALNSHLAETEQHAPTAQPSQCSTVGTRRPDSPARADA